MMAKICREHRQPGAFARRQVEPRLRHETEEPERLERHGLAARVGSRDHEQRLLPADAQVHGDDGALGYLPRLRQQERVARSHDVGHAFLADHGLGRLHGLRELGAREGEIEPADIVDERLELGQGQAYRARERGEHAEHLRFLFARGLHQVVVVLDDALGFDEERGPALGAVVDDALEAGFGLRADGQHVAAVPDRDVTLLEDEIGRGSLEVLLEPLDEVAPEVATLLAVLSERGARLVADAAVGIKRAAEEIGQRRDARQACQGLREPGRLCGNGAAVSAEPPGGVEQGKEGDQLAALGDRSGDTGALEEIADVGDGLPGGCARGGERLPALARLHEGGPDGVQVRLRLEAEGPFAPHRRVSVPGQEVPDPAPLSAPACRD